MNRMHKDRTLKLGVVYALAGIVILAGTLNNVVPAGAWCDAMGGYESYEAQAAAQRRNAEEAERTRRSTIEKSNQASELVKADQQSLKELGYYQGDVDGKAGSAYLASVTSFRKANGLTNGTTLDAQSREMIKGGKAINKEQSLLGIADQKALNSLGYYQGETDGIPSPAFQKAVTYFRAAHNLESGTTLDAAGREVLAGGKAITLAKADQISLKAMGFYTGDVDGKAGPAFQTAINEFNKANGLEGGNTLSAAGREILYGGTAITREQNRQNQVDQKALKDLGYLEGEAGGKPDAVTLQAAIFRFRKANDLEPGTALDATSREIIRQGKAVSQVVADQQTLKVFGFYVGEPDGVADSAATQAAIAGFRVANGLGNCAMLDASSREILFGGKAVAKQQSLEIVADQKALINHGYLQGEPDGMPRSMAFQVAVSNFRRANGLGNGLSLDQESREVLYGAEVITLEQHEQGLLDRVALKVLGYYQGDPGGMPRGDDQAAITDFCKANGLKNCTVLDEASRKILMSGIAVSRSLADTRALRELGFYQGDEEFISETAALLEAVFNFRKANGLDRGSTLDAACRAVISGGKVVTQTMADQQALTALGYYQGGYGNQSNSLSAAISAFRKANDMNSGIKLDVMSRRVLHGGQAVTKATWDARPRWWQSRKDKEANSPAGTPAAAR